MATNPPTLMCEYRQLCDYDLSLPCANLQTQSSGTRTYTPAGKSPRGSISLRDATCSSSSPGISSPLRFRSSMRRSRSAFFNFRRQSILLNSRIRPSKSLPVKLQLHDLRFGSVALTGPGSLIMIAAVYGLQALVFILRRKWDMIGWMVFYILAIPAFSFFLPLYSFWRMDDFSWGQTRVVLGESGKKMIVHVRHSCHLTLHANS